MSRAKWKGPFVSNNLLQECKTTKSEVYTNSRESTIVPKFVGFTINVHNGKGFSKIKITEAMIGHKLGEFSPTRKRFSFKKKKTK
jgi:ribosomal protein S19|tara:strand:+ start:10431 stop:10685 length:255 start_codon:yes stop_codon:yes gene_type:complete